MDESQASPAISAPKVTMPSGGGALRGIGEPFKAESFSGSGGFSVSFPLPEARGFSPSINLSYDSGSGNGLFGLGFSVALDSIVRKTSKGIPRYDDSDVFILNSAGDLLPKYIRSGEEWVKSTFSQDAGGREWQVTGYRSRIEGSFARIEWWVEGSGRESYWKVVTADNVTHLYGVSDVGRIYDPEAPGRVFEWLIERSYDAHGNEIRYHYKPGDAVNLPDTLYNAGRRFCSQRYPDSIQFGKYRGLRSGIEETYFAFELIFDYGQMNSAEPNAPPCEWAARSDPFSTYKSGFEIRTDRICRGLYLRHYFTEENGGKPFITAALLLEYDTTAFSGISRIRSISHRGYRLRPDGPLWIADTPPLQLDYQPFDPLEASWEILEADAPAYMGSSGFLPVDLDGIGIDGLLYSTDHFTGYLAPLGGARYAPLRILDNFPSFRNLSAGQAQLTSLDGNHALDLVVDDDGTKGYFAQEGSGWAAFRPFQHFPVEYRSPRRQMADLSGSGRNDLFFSSGRQLKVYASAGRAGYAEASFAALPADFPVTEQQEATALSGFSDFFGDGLSHRFRLRNGELTVWPCLGGGRFGAPVNLVDAPFIEEGLEADRVFLLDADGSGATDIVYCFSGFIRIWFNRNGNGFSDPVDLKLPAGYDTLASITAGDVQGYGTSALIFTASEPAIQHWYYDFSNQRKPHLLQTIDEGLGSLTRLCYTSSALEHLRDRAEGRNWPTVVPLAVSVVQESRIIDQVTGAAFTQRFRYHDGYFDPVEREFRGFGYVETWDSESYEQFEARAGTHAKAADLLQKKLWTPPVYTRSWFMTGAYEQTPAICDQYASEFYKGDQQQWRIPAFELDATWPDQDAFSVRQAYAALAGQPMRTEVYADDGSDRQGEPYTVSQFGVLVSLVQPRMEGGYCSVLPVPVNELHYRYDRNPEDPLITQQLVLSLDEYGHPLLSAAVSYPRRPVDGWLVYPEQQQLRVLLSEFAYIHSAGDPESGTTWQVLGVNWSTREYEIGGLQTPAAGSFSRESLLDEVQAALLRPVPVDVETEAPDQVPDPACQTDDLEAHKDSSVSQTDGAATQARSDGQLIPPGGWSRLLSWSRQVFWNREGTAALSYGAINELVLLHHQETALLDPDLLQRVFGDKVNTELLTDRCGYVLREGYWWSFGEMQEYNFSDGAFYLPVATQATLASMRDASALEAGGFNGRSVVEYDGYSLLITKTTSRLSESVELVERYEQDYQSLMPFRHVDINENLSEVLLDPLNRVIVHTAYGAVRGAASGDLPLSAYVLQEQADFDSVLAAPDRYLQGASTYFFYDSFAWLERQQPLSAIRITRSLHVHEAERAGAGETVQLPLSISYSDGLGNILQQKEKTTAGSLQLRRIDGRVVNPLPDETVQERWLVSGHTVYNNKGLPAEQYEPYFSVTPHAEDPQVLIDEKRVPPPTVMHYDPIGRLLRTDSPKGFFSKTDYHPWETKAWDFNDTLPESPYYRWFMANYPETPDLRQQEERLALESALPCYRTPSTVVMDNLGNAIRTIACNLGAVGASDIPAAVAGSMTPEEAWSALCAAGYLLIEDPEVDIAWVSRDFQPYQPGFHARFLTQFPENGEAIENYLAQSCMTSYATYDIQGRLLRTADPRLFLKMIREELDLFNFRSVYGLGAAVLLSESADAGHRWSLSNMAGSVVCSWDGRGFLAENHYDNLQRPTGLYVSGGDQGAALANWVHRIEYGEVLEDAADCNLTGKPYREFDESGLSVIGCCDLAGAVLEGETRLRADYKNASNWTAEAQQAILQEPAFRRLATYNAAGQLLEEVLPDGSRQAYSYDINGRLQSSRQQLADPLSGALSAWKPVIAQIDYDVHGKRLRLGYGNGVVSTYTYDAFTGQLLRTFTSRSAAESEKSMLQDLYYSYDPVGHTVSVMDNNASVRFYNNQKIVPRSRYRYDPLYRIICAEGRTLPGLNKPEAEGMHRDTPHRQISPVADLQNLENYSQQFGYDFADNLVLKQHRAASGSRTQTFFITDCNNHLHGITDGSATARPAASSFDYDGNGNLKQLHPNSTARVHWNYLNHISSVVAIQRELTNTETGTPYSLNDAEYYQYNLSGTRVRKVTERLINGGAQVEYTEKIYLGNFQRVRTWSASAEATEAKSADSNTTNQAAVAASDPAVSDAVFLQSEKSTILFKDGDAPVLLTHIWVKAPASLKAAPAAASNGDVQYRYQLGGPLDSVTMEVNDAAELLTYEQYFVYGGTAFSLARSQLEADSKELRFCGKERDAATGLYYYGARYYAPWLNRWMGPDPAGPVDGPNLYEYVGSNPVNYNDPTGMGRNDRKKLVTKAGQAKQNESHKASTLRAGGSKALRPSRVRELKRMALASQDDLEGKQVAGGRKSYYPTKRNPMSVRQKQQYVSSTAGVSALLKVNGMELQMGANGKAGSDLSFPDMGVENQRGQKKNPHAEDWTLSSFRKAVEKSGKDLRTFIDTNFTSFFNNTGEHTANKDVFSLRINYSPCLGCVNTIVGFKEYLTENLGAGKFIFRVKFMRPYNLPNTLTQPDSDTAKDFKSAIEGLKEEGIYVKIQSPFSAAKMHPTYDISDPDVFGTKKIGELFPDMDKDLNMTWTQQNINRKQRSTSNL